MAPITAYRAFTTPTVRLDFGARRTIPGGTDGSFNTFALTNGSEYRLLPSKLQPIADKIKAQPLLTNAEKYQDFITQAVAVLKEEAGQVTDHGQRFKLPDSKTVAGLLGILPNHISLIRATLPIPEGVRAVSSGYELIQDPNSNVVSMKGFPRVYQHAFQILHNSSAPMDTRETGARSQAFGVLKSMGYVQSGGPGKPYELKPPEELPTPAQVNASLEVCQQANTATRFVRFVFRQLIPTGRLGVGQLPPATVLAPELGLDHETVGTALKPLFNEGLLVKDNPKEPYSINPDAIQSGYVPIWERTTDDGKPVLPKPLVDRFEPVAQQTATTIQQLGKQDVGHLGRTLGPIQEGVKGAKVAFNRLPNQ
jgi:hypothetical protein